MEELIPALSAQFENLPYTNCSCRNEWLLSDCFSRRHGGKTWAHFA